MPTLQSRRLLLALLIVPALAGCGRGGGGGNRDLVVTNAGDIATNQAIANQVNADGNDQPHNLAGLPAKTAPPR